MSKTQTIIENLNSGQFDSLDSSTLYSLLKPEDIKQDEIVENLTNTVHLINILGEEVDNIQMGSTRTNTSLFINFLRNNVISQDTKIAVLNSIANKFGHVLISRAFDDAIKNDFKNINNDEVSKLYDFESRTHTVSKKEIDNVYDFLNNKSNEEENDNDEFKPLEP